MENAKKPAVFLPISLKPLSKYLVAQNGAFERQIAAILTHRRHFICRTLNLNSLSFLASLVTSTGSTNLARPAWRMLQNLQSFFHFFPTCQVRVTRFYQRCIARRFRHTRRLRRLRRLRLRRLLRRLLTSSRLQWALPDFMSSGSPGDGEGDGEGEASILFKFWATVSTSREWSMLHHHQSPQKMKKYTTTASHYR